MPTYRHIPLTLISLHIAATALGCTAAVLPLPPPSPSIVGLDPVDAGEVEVGAGLNTLVGETGGTGTLQIPNIYGGGTPVYAAFGLNDRLTLTGSYAAWALGYNGGIGLGIKLADSERGGLSALVGTGAYLHLNEVAIDITPTDENGEPLEGAEPETEFRPYAYLGFAPNLGIQGHINLSERLAWQSMARVSISQPIPLVGLDWDDMHRGHYVEATTGLQYEVLDDLQVGAGVYGGLLEGAPVIGGSISASGTFARRQR